MLGDILNYNQLPGWDDDDHAAALSSFLKSARVMLEKTPKSRGLSISGEALRDISDWLFHLDEGVLGDEARIFFETHFVPRAIKPNDNPQPSDRGFVTGYFEPEVLGSRQKSERFSTPLLRRPLDLVRVVDVAEEFIPENWDKEIRFAKQGESGHIEPYMDRADILNGGLDGQGLEIVFLESPIDAFFIHIQGSARIRLEDNSFMRVSYAAKTGHDYTPIGRLLIERNEIAREEMSMEAIRSWLTEHADQQNEVMSHNRSYIFFSEVMGLDPEDGPIGAGGVPLSTRRSLAVDRTLHTFGTPIFLNADLDEPFQHLMIAQDTGSAIVGPARGDIYFGAGQDAEREAGAIQHAADFYLLWPKHQPI